MSVNWRVYHARSVRLHVSTSAAAAVVVWRTFSLPWCVPTPAAWSPPTAAPTDRWRSSSPCAGCCSCWTRVNCVQSCRTTIHPPNWCHHWSSDICLPFFPFMLLFSAEFAAAIKLASRQSTKNPETTNGLPPPAVFSYRFVSWERIWWSWSRDFHTKKLSAPKKVRNGRIGFLLNDNFMNEKLFV